MIPGMTEAQWAIVDHMTRTDGDSSWRFGMDAEGRAVFEWRTMGGISCRYLIDRDGECTAHLAVPYGGAF